MNGRVFNIFKVLAHHPKLVKRWTPFAGHILGQADPAVPRSRALDPAHRLAEPGRVRIRPARADRQARRRQRCRHRAAQGRPEGQGLERRRGGAAAGRRRSLSRTRWSRTTTWAALSKNYSTEQLMDAVFTVGQYNMVSWALKHLWRAARRLPARSSALGWPWRKAGDGSGPIATSRKLSLWRRRRSAPSGDVFAPEGWWAGYGDQGELPAAPSTAKVWYFAYFSPTRRTCTYSGSFRHACSASMLGYT